MIELNTEDYVRWKKWGDPSAYGAPEKRIWDDLHAALGVASGSRLLEIGFGQGAHLHYCRSKGVNASGVEQNEAGFTIAQRNNLDVQLGDLKLMSFPKASFDAVIGLDVIEHIPIEPLVEMLRHIKSLLKPGGLALFSFPNGASPFGRLQQHGDLTHVNAFNRSSMEQLCVLTGFQIVRFEDYPEYFQTITLGQKIKSPIRKLMRKTIKLFVKTYFDEPLGMSVICVLKPL